MLEWRERRGRFPGEEKEIPPLFEDDPLKPGQSSIDQLGSGDGQMPPVTSTKPEEKAY